MMQNKSVLILILVLIFGTSTSFGQNDPINIGGVDFDYMRPQTYELGPIRVEGADNFDHNAIKLLAGLRQGQSITIPGEKITKAVNNLWNEGLFSDVEIWQRRRLRVYCIW